MQRRILTIAQAGAEVGVSRRTIYNWLAASRVEFCRTPGGSVRIYADALTRPGCAAEFTRPEPPTEPPIPPIVASAAVWEETPGYREHCEQRWREAQALDLVDRQMESSLERWLSGNPARR